MSVRKKLDPERTRLEVLDSAMRLFSRKGFAGTSIADIATEAKVTKSLVLYHFGTKEELWQKALQERLWPIVQTLLRYAMGDPDLTFLDILRQRFELMRDNPEIARMIRWMTLDDAPPPHALKEVVPLVVARGMREAAARELPDGVTPQMIPVLVMGACDSWFAYRGLYSAVSGVELGGPDSDEKFFQTLLALLPAGFKGGD